SRMKCRHKMLSEYFGQAYERSNCEACDVCLDEMESMPDATVTAQKILSCVARMQERFGAMHVVDVLLGADTERVRQCGHSKLSTYGLLKDSDKKTLTNLVYQMIDQGLLERTDDEFPVLKLNAASWEVLRGTRGVRLIQPKASGVKRTKIEEVEWQGVDRGLFESLRALRRMIATERSVPAYVVFGDATLREMARVRPGTLRTLLNIRGVGQRKVEELGERFVQHMVAYCREHNLQTDAAAGSRPITPPPVARLTSSQRAAFELFAQGKQIEEVMQALDRARSTTVQYLVDYIQSRKPQRIDHWVAEATYRRVAAAAAQLGTGPLKPIFDSLAGKIPYDTIKLVVRHLEVRE
ncbi:MAG TPA: RQC domain-containing protein, partial [Phycisphaerae bacterium]